MSKIKGYKKFSQENILEAYYRNCGVAMRMAADIGYINTRALVFRVNQVDASTLLKLHTKMKLNGKMPEMTPYKKKEYPIFFRVEKLLTLHYEGQYKGTFPESMITWTPEENGLWKPLTKTANK